MILQIMTLKIKENKESKFYKKYTARLFNNDEMEKLVCLAAAAIKCGCEIKVELNEIL